jgi:hypothetical protein
LELTSGAERRHGPGPTAPVPHRAVRELDSQAGAGRWPAADGPADDLEGDHEDRQGTAERERGSVVARGLRIAARQEERERKSRNASRRKGRSGAAAVFRIYQSRRAGPLAPKCRFYGKSAVAGQDVC